MRIITDPDEARAAFEPWRKKHARPAWKPVTEFGEGPVAGSRFGGRPALREGEAWPTCAACGKPQTLFLQLDLDALPAEANPNGSGLLQFFYCTRDDETTGGFQCEVENEGWEPGSQCHLFRVLPPGEATTLPPAEDGPILAARAICDWKAFNDFRHWEEDLPSDVRVDRVEGETPWHLVWDEGGVTFASAINDFDIIRGEAAPGDKLGGWPAWSQGPEWPESTADDEPVRLLMQIDSEDNLDFMFGDMGCGHLMQCPKHPDQLTFGWACG